MSLYINIIKKRTEKYRKEINKEERLTEKKISLSSDQ